LAATEVPRPLASWRGTPVHAVAGIGVPERFFGQLEDLGLTVERHAFADHHAYRPADLAFGDSAPILMTEKDAIKCRAFADERAWFVSAEVIDEDGLAQAVIQRLAARNTTAEKDNGPAAA
ncbi:MAG: tetraacyldisaccharide 4'-kinase, partial [Halofilum sp. (in: g-proteobacteria)]